MGDASHAGRSSELQFMACLADQGFSYAGQYLEQQCRCSVGIFGPDGGALYRTSDDIVAAFSAPTSQEDASAYDVARSELVYSIALDSGRACIVLRPINADAAASASEVLEDVRVPLTYHLVSHQSSRRRIEALEKDVSAELFARGCETLAAFARDRGYEIDERASYFVTVTRLVQGSRYDWAATTESVRGYLREQGAADVIDVGIADGFIHVFPATYVLSEAERSVGWQRLYDIERHKRVHDERNGIVTSVGVGRPYPFAELERSFHEAMQAQGLGWLMGRGGAVMRYDRLGVFALLLDGDRAALEAYCARTLGPLVESEAVGAPPLLDTLRLMLDHSFRWADVSRLLFVHVNTLRYRMDRIAELLSVDLGDAAVRADLFVALKLHDLLSIVP